MVAFTNEVAENSATGAAENGALSLDVRSSVRPIDDTAVTLLDRLAAIELDCINVAEAQRERGELQRADVVAAGIAPVCPGGAAADAGPATDSQVDRTHVRVLPQSGFDGLPGCQPPM